jgi:hypothetical protein
VNREFDAPGAGCLAGPGPRRQAGGGGGDRPLRPAAHQLALAASLLLVAVVVTLVAGPFAVADMLLGLLWLGTTLAVALSMSRSMRAVERRAERRRLAGCPGELAACLDAVARAPADRLRSVEEALLPLVQWPSDATVLARRLLTAAVIAGIDLSPGHVDEATLGRGRRLSASVTALEAEPPARTWLVELPHATFVVAVGEDGLDVARAPARATDTSVVTRQEGGTT